MDLATDTQRYTEERSRCMDKKCKRRSTYSVSCQTHLARVEIAPRLVDVGSGAVVYSRRHQAAKEAKGCSDGGLPSHDVLLGQALDEVVAAVRRDVAPSVELVKVGLKGALRTAEGSSAATFTNALKFMNAGDSDRACRMWEELEQGGLRDPHLSYNLAVCDERVGDVQEALERVQEAYESLAEPDKDFIAARARYQTLLDERGALSDQMARPQQP